MAVLANVAAAADPDQEVADGDALFTTVAPDGKAVVVARAALETLVSSVVPKVNETVDSPVESAGAQTSATFALNDTLPSGVPPNGHGASIKFSTAALAVVAAAAVYLL